MAVTAALTALTIAGASTAASHKKRTDAKDRIKRRKSEAKIRVLEENRRAAAGQTIAGQAGSGSLLTGAGGLSDPGITGKQTLLGKQ